MKKDDLDYITRVEQVYKEYRNLVYTIAYAILRDNELAEDATQETMLKLLKHSDKIDPDKKAETKNYVARVARNTSFDFYNDRKRDQSAHEFAEELMIKTQSANDENDPEKYVITNESVNRIIDEIRNMDPKYSDPLRFQKFNGHNITEIADIMGVCERTVHYRIDKAKRILKAKLMEEETYDE